MLVGTRMHPLVINISVRIKINFYNYLGHNRDPGTDSVLQAEVFSFLVSNYYF